MKALMVPALFPLRAMAGASWDPENEILDGLESDDFLAFLLMNIVGRFRWG
ncbi:MAG: hypothetical protein R2750_08455 [Bacteroidales bacterium]